MKPLALLERYPEAHGPARSVLKRWRHRLSPRVATVFVLLALVLAVVFVAATQRLVSGGWQAWAQPLVADYVDRLTLELGTPPDKDRAVALAARLPVSVRIEGPMVRFDSHPADRTAALLDPHMTAEGWGLARRTADGHVVTFGLTSLPASFRTRLVGWAALTAMLLFTAIAWLAVRQMLRPLDAVQAGAARFARGDYATPIALDRPDEIGELGERVDAMARSLQGTLDAKQALLQAISHELRSPLTRARLNAEQVADGPAKAALLRDLSEMRDLITDLLESERIAEGRAALKIESVKVPALAKELIEARFAGQPLQLALDESLPAIQADGARLKLMLRNMVDNALRHSTEAAIVPLVSFTRDGDGQLRLSVRDYGPTAISDEQLARLSEPFLRPEGGRQRSTGGVGLGLYLSRLVAEAHGGTLSIRRMSPGLEVAARWPAVTRSGG